MQSLIESSENAIDSGKRKRYLRESFVDAEERTNATRESKRRKLDDRPHQTFIPNDVQPAPFDSAQNSLSDAEGSSAPIVELHLRDRDCAIYVSLGENPSRPPTRSEITACIEELESRRTNGPTIIQDNIVLRKLKLLLQTKRASPFDQASMQLPSTPLTPLPRTTFSPANQHTIDALYSIGTTAYENSFLSRICGHIPEFPVNVYSLDWDTRTPWMDLMDDIRLHYALSHRERDPGERVIAPIVYSPMEAFHLGQVHDILSRAFWNGIDVSDCLAESPERCTVVATYRKIVVGAAFLSSPHETYITYLVVRAGWNNSRIATTMLYHLMMLNPLKDITLHVSTNNSAMILYNRFGFKAEEFIVDFYEDYLDPNSRASKNAFKLRFRR